MSNSNLVIPTSDDSESSLSDSSDDRNYSRKNRKLILEKKAKINQCTACAGYHDLSECVNRRGNQKYLHYENVRNKFAKDVGFNYRRGGDYQSYNYNNSRDDPRYQKRDRYDDRKIDYHRGGGDRLRWDDHRNGGNDSYGGKRYRRDTDNQSFYEENKKRMKYSENSNSNSSLGELLKFSKSNKHYSSRIANDPRLKNSNSNHSSFNNNSRSTQS